MRTIVKVTFLVIIFICFYLVGFYLHKFSPTYWIESSKTVVYCNGKIMVGLHKKGMNSRLFLCFQEGFFVIFWLVF